MRLAAGFLVLLLLPVAGQAHGLGVAATLTNGTVAVAAFYDDDTPAAGATVTVEDESKAVVAAGRTDDRGEWSFPAPPPGRYRITVTAVDAHTAKRTLIISAADDSTSDGPTREEFTGPIRWVWTAVGVLAIAGLTLGVRAALRRRAGQSAPAERPDQPRPLR